MDHYYVIAMAKKKIRPEENNRNNLLRYSNLLKRYS